MDGKLLARAREEKEEIRRRSIREDRRRHEEAYAKIPELRRLDGQIAALTAQAAAAAVGGAGRPLEELRRESLDLQARRAELLADHGWPIDWLDGAWDCPKCRDTGYVQGHVCTCLEKLYEKARVQDLSALLRLGNESFSTFDLTLYDDRPDPATGVTPRQHMENVLGVCHDYALNFRQVRSDLLFRGATGLGKTFLSACIAREVSRQGFSVVYETAGAAMTACERQRFSRDWEEADEAESQVRRMTECDLLILDDLGTEMVTDFSRSALYALVNDRLIGSRRTIISTNLTSAQLEKRYTPQIMSRLEGEYLVLPFVGSDIRKIRKTRSLGSMS